MGACYTNMGDIAAGLGDFDQAMRLYGKALAISKELGDMAEVGDRPEMRGEIAAAKMSKFPISFRCQIESSEQAQLAKVSGSQPSSEIVFGLLGE